MFFSLLFVRCWLFSISCYCCSCCYCSGLLWLLSPQALFSLQLLLLLLLIVHINGNVAFMLFLKLIIIIIIIFRFALKRIAGRHVNKTGEMYLISLYVLSSNSADISFCLSLFGGGGGGR